MSNLQNKFINHLVDGGSECTCFLTNGVRLSGALTFNDTDSVILSRDGVSQLIMKHAIATVMPADAFSMYDVMRGQDNEHTR